MRRSTTAWYSLLTSPNLTVAIHKKTLSLILVSNLCCWISPFPVLSDLVTKNQSTMVQFRTSISYPAQCTPPTPAVGPVRKEGTHQHPCSLPCRVTESTATAGWGARGRGRQALEWYDAIAHPFLSGYNWPATLLTVPHHLALTVNSPLWWFSLFQAPSHVLV